MDSWYVLLHERSPEDECRFQLSLIHISCVIEGEEMALRIADRIVKITDKLGIPYVFKDVYKRQYLVHDLRGVLHP